MKTSRFLLSILAAGTLSAFPFSLNASSVDEVTLVDVKVPTGAGTMGKGEAYSKANEIAGVAKAVFAQNHQSAWGSQVVTRGDLKMPFTTTVFGEKNVGGYPILVSLHPAGASKTETDALYEKQQHIYDEFMPSKCIYMVPRSPYNTSDPWNQPGIDSLILDMVNMAIANLGANPNKVYLVGKNAGADGVWSLASTLQGRWAACAVLAGHPVDAPLYSFCNTPLAVWRSEKEGDENSTAQSKKLCSQLDSLNASPTVAEYYVYNCRTFAGNDPEWDAKEGAAVDWVAGYSRKPSIKHLTWEQGSVPSRSFFWLSVPDSVEVKPGNRASVGINHDNVITVERCDYPELSIWLDDDMVDLDNPVTVVYDGKTVFSGTVPRKKGVIDELIFGRKDFGLGYYARITFVQKKQK